MKTVLNFFLISFVILFVKCNSFNKKGDKENKNTNYDSIYRGEQIKSSKVRIYEIDSSFHYFLDTIIESEKKCPYYSKNYSGFKYSIALFSESPDIEEMSISSINIYTYDYSKSYGIFEYKEHRFICDSICNKEILKPTKNYVTVRYIIQDNSKTKYDKDDRYSSWYYVYKNKKFITTGHNPCYIPKVGE